MRAGLRPSQVGNKLDRNPQFGPANLGISGTSTNPGGDGMKAKKIREINFGRIQSICAVNCESIKNARRARPSAVVLVKSRPQGWSVTGMVSSFLRAFGMAAR